MDGPLDDAAVSRSKASTRSSAVIRPGPVPVIRPVPVPVIRPVPVVLSVLLFLSLPVPVILQFPWPPRPAVRRDLSPTNYVQNLGFPGRWQANGSARSAQLGLLVPGWDACTPVMTHSPKKCPILFRNSRRSAASDCKFSDHAEAAR